MTQKEAEPSRDPHNEARFKKSTRIEDAEPDLYDPTKPRLGRRESEPHSAEITYIHDVLTTNFPESRTTWDLHHYFKIDKGPLKGEEIDIRFDISFLKDFSIPHLIPSYDASDYGGKVPDMVINVLSKSTWKTDLSENVDIAKNLEIPIYAIYSPYKVTSKIYHPPFLRVYLLNDDGSYRQEELHNVTLKEDGTINKENVIDISEVVPLWLGLMQIDKSYVEDQPLFRLIFIDPSEEVLLPTRRQRDIKKVKEESQEEIKKVKEESQEEITKLKKKLKKYKDQFGKLE